MTVELDVPLAGSIPQLCALGRGLERFANELPLESHDPIIGSRTAGGAQDFQRLRAHLEGDARVVHKGLGAVDELLCTVRGQRIIGCRRPAVQASITGLTLRDYT